MDGADWFKNAIIYHILIDRFAGFKSNNYWDRPNFLGGNIKGIIEKIPYLKNLGVNTIWISPFYKTTEYHGYHITDFYKVDSHFGTLKHIENLIRTAHSNDIKIIADFVPNHCSDQHPFFKKAIKEKNSEYKNWFYFKRWPKDYLCFLSVKQLPKINLEFTESKYHIINAAKHWLSLGFDGFRLDHVIGPTHDFWKHFKKEIKSIFPNAVLIGEAWMMGIKFKELKTININHKYIKWIRSSSSYKLFGEYIRELDGVLDFRFQELIRDYLCFNKQDENEFHDKLKKHYNKFPKNYFLPAFLDNHDMDRFLYNCKNNKQKLIKAIKILMDLSQPVILYYGTESGITQPKSQWQFSQYGDLMARKPMNWDDVDQQLIETVKKLVYNRKRE